MIRVLGHVRALLKLSNAQGVSRYEPAYARVPIPDTWGEVALVQLRLLAGTWYPKNHARVEIEHNSVILGEAWMSDGWMGGKDVHPRPQRNDSRPSWYLLEEGTEGTSSCFEPREVDTGGKENREVDVDGLVFESVLFQRSEQSVGDEKKARNMSEEAKASRLREKIEKTFVDALKWKSTL